MIIPAKAMIKEIIYKSVICSFKKIEPKSAVNSGARFMAIATVDNEKYLTVIKLTVIEIFPCTSRVKKLGICILPSSVCKESHRTFLYRTFSHKSMINEDIIPL
jgi:hypothetical protein